MKHVRTKSVNLKTQLHWYTSHGSNIKKSEGNYPTENSNAVTIQWSRSCLIGPLS